jgi:peptidoglycan-N-acetylglucosamine deacetylase
MKSYVTVSKVLIFCSFYLLLIFQETKSIPYIIPIDDEGQKTYSRTVKDIPLYAKEVFLTFDDGPSRNNTPKILEILKENCVKGTFFVVGKNAEQNPDIIKDLHDNGMSIVAHSHTHDYSIYRDANAYMMDLNKCNEVIQSIINDEPLPFIRLPGGSDNRMGSFREMKKIRMSLREKELSYVDWNVSSADAARVTVAMSTIKENVISQCKSLNFAVVLMHDSSVKTTTVEALPHIIKYLKDQGYVFRTFKDITAREYDEMVRRRIINR